MAKDKKPKVLTAETVKTTPKAKDKAKKPEVLDNVQAGPEKIADPLTGKAVKAKAIKLFKSINTNLKLPIYITNKRGEEIKVYAHFKENQFATADEQYIKRLQEKIDEYDENEVPLGQRDILTEEQFFSIVSPEKLYVPYHDNKLHLSRVVEGLEFAESKGWVPDYTEVKLIQSKKSRVRSGSVSAGSAG